VNPTTIPRSAKVIGWKSLKVTTLLLPISMAGFPAVHADAADQFPNCAELIVFIQFTVNYIRN
jgi:hypothetical protein